MRKLIILLVFSFVATNILAQNTIKGTIYDQDNKPVDLAFVNVFNDSVLVSRVYSEKDGNFSLDLETGNYKFQVGFFQTMGLDTSILVTKSIDFGRIKINTAKELSEITVTEHRPILTQKADRMIYNVSNDNFTEGRSAIDAIARAPRISVNKQANTITMIGRSGVKVLLDGRLQDDETAKNIIQNLRAEDIDKIEIIPLPPAKYSASGNYGMINIVTKNSLNYGFSGNANATYNFFDNDYSLKGGLNLNYRTKKVDVKASFNPKYTELTNQSSLKYDYKDSVYNSNSYRNGLVKNWGTNEIIKYYPNSKIETGVVFNYNRMEEILKDNTISMMSRSKNDMQENAVTDYNTAMNNLNLSAYSDIKLSENGKKMSLTYNLSKSKLDMNDIISSDKVDNTKMMWYNNYQMHNGMLDFVLPMGKMYFETGASALIINNTNSVNFSSEENFEYTEQTYAAYVSAARPITDKFAAKIGLRYEFADIDGKTKDYDNVVDNSFPNLFPSVYLNYMLRRNSNLSFSYAKRIERPSFHALNPFRIYKNATSYYTGKSDIDPQYFHNFEISYSLGGLYINSWLAISRDNISTISGITNEGLEEYKYENSYNEDYWGLGINYKLNPVDFVSISLYTNIKYRSIEGCKKEFEIESLDSWGSEFNATIDCFLNSKKTFMAEIYTAHEFPEIGFGGEKEHEWAETDFSIMYKTLDNNFSVSVYVDDIFNQTFSRSTKYYKTYTKSSTYWAFTRCFGVAVNYRFGKHTVKDVNKYLKSEGRNRM